MGFNPSFVSQASVDVTCYLGNNCSLSYSDSRGDLCCYSSQHFSHQYVVCFVVFLKQIKRERQPVSSHFETLKETWEFLTKRGGV